MGTVVQGDQLGRALGFPTANLDVSVSDTGLEDGVYTATTTIGKETYPSALVVNSKINRVEVHLLDQNMDLYGQELVVVPRMFMSAYQNIPEKDQLIQKIEQDIQAIRAWFDKQ